MNIITLDMETYYSDEFSLTKLTTEEYIRSPEFETICCAVKVNDSPTVVLHPSQIREYLLRNNIQESALLCHHTAFDGFILSHHYGLIPKHYLDTLSMARALHGLTISCSLASLSDHYDLGKKGYEVVNAKGKRLKDFKGVDYELYKSYCANDVELTYKLFLKLLEKTPKQELKYISLMLKCYCDPKLVLNKEILDVYAQELESKKEFFLDTLGISEKDLRSDAKFAALLEEQGIDPPTKINKNGEIKFAFAKTDEEFRELEDHPNDTVGMLVAARLGVKTTIESTRAARLQSIATRGKLPIPMSYYGAHTGRPSAWDKINPLNFKKKSPIRTAIEAPKGYLFADCDSAQIEARGNAWFSGQDDLVLAFRHKEDVYSQFATELFNEEVRKPRKEDAPELYQLLDTRRFIGKQCVAEGQLVLTNVGLVPIEKITLDMRVWDGVEWVTHQGLIYRGEKEVITYDGLTATPDHEVYTDDGRKISFGEAASKMVRLRKTGFGRQEIRVPNNYEQRLASNQRNDLYRSRVQHNWHQKISLFRQYLVGQIKEFCTQWQNPYSCGLSYSWASMGCNNCTLSESELSKIQGLWWSRNQSFIQNSKRVLSVGFREFTTSGLQWFRNRSYRQQWTLCARKFKVVNATGKYTESPQYSQDNVAWKFNSSQYLERKSLFGYGIFQVCSERIDRRANYRESQGCGAKPPEKLEQNLRQITRVRVYDILNAGPRHRFTVSNALISNCILGFGYQMGDAKFLKTVESLSLTMLGRKVEVPPRLASQAKKLYRNKYAMIKQMWYACEEMLFAIATGQERSFGYGCKIITCSEGFIKPNGTMIRYPNLRQENGSWVYSVKKGRAKVDKHIYGGKVLENIVQSLARDVIMHQWKLISERYDVVMMVYDALGCLIPENEKEEGEAFVKHCMMQTPDWAVGLPLDCDFSIGANYGEC